jgi:hypothetical protein
MIRSLKFVLAALSVVLLTTGCVKLNVDLTVNGDDTVSGTMVFAVSKELAALSEESESSGTGTETEGLLKNAENVTIEPFDDGDFVGSTYTFEGLLLEEFAPEIGEESAFGLSREGDNLIVAGVIDTSSDSEELENNPFAGAFLAGLVSSSDLRVSITLPGEIKETNGTVEGQTITWKGSFGKKLEMNAIAYAPLTNPLILIVGSSLGAGLLIGLIALVFLRAKRSKEGKGPENKKSSGSFPRKVSVSSKVGLSDADIKALESEYASNPERFAMDYLSPSEFAKWRASGEPSLKPWIGMGMVNFKKWLDLHK